ncbi:MAG: sigma-54 dependent transcriptional regulator [Bacteroidota bacterium]
MDHSQCRVLAVDDEEAFREVIMSLLSEEGYPVATAVDGVEAINLLQQNLFDVILLDIRMPKVDGVEVLKYLREHMPDAQVIMLTGVTELKLAVECMKLGAYDFIAKPHSTPELLTTVERAYEKKQLLIENRTMKEELSRVVGPSDIIGKSNALKEVIRIAGRVAPTESTVLIQGGSGTGKELLAHFVYKNSNRKEKQFVIVNCASIPDTLIESELFGHEKGAFTDAHQQKQGLVELANGGTLFLDEVGDVSPIIQPKLLRFIQSGEFRRVGGNATLRADVRIISATNKDLREEVKLGRFREDLLYRLNVITITIPLLRERKEDIPDIVQFFLQSKLRSKTKKTINLEAIDLLMHYDWPGNIRELENVIERAAILSRGTVIDPADLSLGPSSPVEKEQSEIVGTSVSLEHIQRLHIEKVLKAQNWNKTSAAKILEISLKTLYTKIQQYGLKQE